MTTGRINQVTTLYTLTSIVRLRVDKQRRTMISCIQSASTNQGHSLESKPTICCVRLLPKRILEWHMYGKAYSGSSIIPDCHQFQGTHQHPCCTGLKIAPSKQHFYKHCQRALRFTANWWWRCNLRCKVHADGKPQTNQGKAPKDTRTHKWV